MVGQERELAEARLLQEHARVARQIGQDLVVLLSDHWTRSQVSFESSASLGDPSLTAAVVFSAEVRDGRLVLPWENREPGLSPGDVPLLERGERQELAAGDLEAAAGTYLQALDRAANQEQAALARLFLARVLAKSGRPEEAATQYRALLALPAAVTDELGMPLCFYAAERMLGLGLANEELARFLSREARGREWYPPSATHLLHDVASGLTESLPAGHARDSVAVAQSLLAVRVGEVEQGLTLARDLPSLQLSAIGAPGAPPERWVLHGSDPWLVGLGQAGSGSPLLTAVRASQAVEAAALPMEETVLDLRLVPGWAPDGLILDPRIRGLRVRFDLAEAEDLEGAVGRQRVFYSVVLLLVVGFTLFGGYLLWRDVQREVGMARLRSQFVSGVSHELRTPLTSIRMFAETLLDRGPEDRKTQEEFLGTIVEESNRLSRLLGNVLEFSAVEGGKRQYQMRPRDMAEIVQAAIRAIRQRLDSEGFTLSTEMESGLPPVSVDGDAIEQAVLNLLTNAMKYSGQSRDIGLDLRRQGEDILIAVSDRGIGIGPSEQRRIFESFYRGDSPAVEEIPGTGLGLTLVDHIATAHGGSVELESAPGEGSTFTLRIPLRHQEP
jgi:signal transduction histidine kinase